MASENAVKDANSSRGLLLHDSTGTETRKAKAGPSGGMQVEDTQVSSIYRSIDVDETEEDAAPAGSVLTGYWLSNRSAAEKVVKIYDGQAANVTVGATAPKMTIPLAANQSANLSRLQVSFPNGICIAATTGIADNDTGAPATNDVVANIFYRPS